MNRSQGLGVCVFGIVLDKPKLFQVATVLVSLGSSLAIVLWEVGKEVHPAWRGAGDSVLYLSGRAVRALASDERNRRRHEHDMLL